MRTRWTPCFQAFEIYFIGGVLGQVRSSSDFQILLCTEIENVYTVKCGLDKISIGNHSGASKIIN